MIPTEVQSMAKYAQAVFGRGLVIFAGAGLAANFRLPTMIDLAKVLTSELDIHPWENGENRDHWGRVRHRLAQGVSLEDALHDDQLSDAFFNVVRQYVSSFILKGEREAFHDAVLKDGLQPLQRLLRLAIRAEPCLPVVTTNYDRIIEFAAEASMIGVDCSFPGALCSPIEPSTAGVAHQKYIKVRGKPVAKHLEHVKIYKPHGSLDWYIHKDRPLRSHVDLPLDRLIILPGSRKYLDGYRAPFDLHRESANDAIDRARSLLVIGYGFNDVHLETHLIDRIRSGIPAFVLTRSISEKAREVIQGNSNAGILGWNPKTNLASWVTSNEECALPLEWAGGWQIGQFVGRVLP